MLLVADVRAELRQSPPPGLSGLERLQHAHSRIPAVTHVDYSARVQTVDQNEHPLFHALLSRFEKATGCPLLVNTSFNVRGEPIVCSPADAYRCFLKTNMDALVLGNYVLLRAEQPVGRLEENYELQPD
jgi:carbamoyltransferase